MIYNTLGNTMTIQWPVYIVDSETPLDEMDVNVYVEYNRFKKKMTIDIEDNVISFTFEGKDQRAVGSYDLVLYVNEGKTDQMKLTNKDAFTLIR